MKITANYLMRYKGTYRLKTEYDKETNMFPREYTNEFASQDVYIDCNQGIRIHHYGKSILEAYIPSLQSGRSILRFYYRDHVNCNNTETTITEYDVVRKGKQIHVVKENVHILNKELYKQELQNDNVIFHIEETDSEVLFRFHSKYLEKLEPYLKPKTNGAGISPFSSKNLPKSKYTISDKDLSKYKEIVSNLPKNQLITLVHITKDFMQSLTNKKYTYEDMKADMALKGLKGKEYIHSIGKWEDYITYLKERL